MSFRIVDQVLDAGLESPTDVLVMVAIAKFADASGKAFPSQSTIAEITALNRATVCRAIKSLCERGLLTKKRAFSDASTYQITIKKLEEMKASKPSRLCATITSDGGSQVTEDHNVCDGGSQRLCATITSIVTEDHTNLSCNRSENLSENRSMGKSAISDSAQEKSFALEASPKASTPKAKSKAKREAFIPPTLETWMTFADTLSPPLPKPNAYSAFHHYEAKGWTIGRDKMKNWHAACRTCHGRWINDGCKQPAAINGSNGNH